MWKNCFLHRNGIAGCCRRRGENHGASVTFTFSIPSRTDPVRPFCTIARKGAENTLVFRRSWFSSCQDLKTHTSIPACRYLSQTQFSRNSPFKLGADTDLSRWPGYPKYSLGRNVSPRSSRTALRLVSMDSRQKKSERSVLIYISAMGIFMIGMTYAGVPLYRIFCQSSGLGGQAVKGHDTTKLETMTPVKDRLLKVRFNADTASSMQWNFRPQQPEVNLLPGETALAFYTAKNPTNKAIIGISTYNVVPFEAGQYFNKIQCFCFEEQRLNPHEEVDMPVFFYIDPDYVDDPKLELVDTITLSYTFFEAKEGMHIPVPSYATARH